jgi:hypothetical protein
VSSVITAMPIAYACLGLGIVASTIIIANTWYYNAKNKIGKETEELILFLVC